MYDDKQIQTRMIAGAIVDIIPQAARIAQEWATKLYEAGTRMHPELAQNTQPTIVDAEPQEDRMNTVKAQSMATLRQMADQFPQFRPLVAKIEAAKTPEEMHAAAEQLKQQIQPDLMASAQARVDELRDNTQ